MLSTHIFLLFQKIQSRDIRRCTNHVFLLFIFLFLANFESIGWTNYVRETLDDYALTVSTEVARSDSSRKIIAKNEGFLWNFVAFVIGYDCRSNVQ